MSRELSNKYAYDDHKNIIHISRANRGLKCRCTCIECGDPLIARKGKKNRHHFAHHDSSKVCIIPKESALHLYAKEVIERHHQISLPKNHQWRAWKGSGRVKFSRVLAEKKIGTIRPDLTAILKDGKDRLYLEIVVTHPLTEEKIATIHALGLAVIVIDLNEIVQKKMHFPSREVEDFIINGLDNKRWIAPNPTPPSALQPESSHLRSDLAVQPTPNQTPHLLQSSEPFAPESDLFSTINLHICISRELNEAALEAASQNRRSIAEQIAHWAELGRKSEQS